uniref:DUF4220 domain-containing protein n=1 Tax=Setaria italica TaxID=4555 RepID=K3ZNL5_SETIT
MTDIQSAIQWWEEWQLRVLVLGSLVIQWFLLVAAPMRKYTISSVFRRCIWLAYISSDALAIYALATLFNRHARASSAYDYDAASKATSLEVLWAPLLLVHLGGRDEITAFNIQDNELWTRQTVTVVSQVTVAVYAFYKSWPDAADRRLLLSAIMLFISGVINFCEKPWALRSASINRLVAVSSTIQGQKKELSLWERLFTEMDGHYQSCWVGISQERDKRILSEMDKVQMILSDISLLAAVGKEKEKNDVLATLSPGVEMTPWLRRAFELIYTRANVIYAPAYMTCDFVLVPALYIAAITLFAMGHKQGYNATDIKMTYIFMVFTAVLDALGVLISKQLYKLMSMTRIPALCTTLAEYNLINSVAKRMKPTTGWLLKCATCFGCGDYSFGDRNRSAAVADFVVFELLKPGRVEGLDLASYRSLTKPNWALGNELRDYVRHGPEIVRRSLSDSPFDESVLLWHIATDLCYRFMPRSRSIRYRDECIIAISNYMGYLLKFQPEMLMTGSRPHLFTLTMGNLEKLLQGKKGKPLDIVLEIIMDEIEGKKYPLLHNACMLAKELMASDPDKHWKLIYGVWMGMLCYSASMCRGYLHARSLGEGGEFLSYVWIVISLKGAKTLADKLQMSEEATTCGPQTEESEQDIQSLFGHGA